MTYLQRFLNSAAVKPAVLLVTAVACVGLASGQAPRKSAASEEQPFFHEYRGVEMGWGRRGRAQKLGAPADKGDEQDFYVSVKRKRPRFFTTRRRTK
jgi:hypothetical protein